MKDLVISAVLAVTAAGSAVALAQSSTDFPHYKFVGPGARSGPPTVALKPLRAAGPAASVRGDLGDPARSPQQVTLASRQ